MTPSIPLIGAHLTKSTTITAFAWDFPWCGKLNNLIRKCRNITQSLETGYLK